MVQSSKCNVQSKFGHQGIVSLAQETLAKCYRVCTNYNGWSGKSASRIGRQMDGATFQRTLGEIAAAQFPPATRC
jgi:hypothetical protein